MPSRHEKFLASIEYFCNNRLQCDSFKLEECAPGSLKKKCFREYSLELFEMEGKLSIPQFKEHFDNYFGEYRDFWVRRLLRRGVIIGGDSHLMFKDGRGVIIGGDSELMFKDGALYVTGILVYYRNKQPMPFKVIEKKANVIDNVSNLQNENIELRKKIEKANEANLILLERNQLLDRSLELYRKNKKDTESSITSLFDIVNELYRKNEEQKECPICFEDIEPNNLFVSKCKHYLCKRCAFLQHSNNCSICRDNWGEAISRYIEHIPPKRFTSGKVKAIVDYKARCPKELSLKKGSIIEIWNLAKKGKYCEGVDLETGRRGLFIREHCEFLE